MSGLAATAGLVRVGWDDLPGWHALPVARAFAAFRGSASAIRSTLASLRPARDPEPAFAAICGRAASCQGLTDVDARSFFETHFKPTRVDAPAGGFLTGYYEPVVTGDLKPSADFAAPVLAPPVEQPWPVRDRAAWEAFAISEQAQPILWLRDWTEVFLIHVQGSARVVLPDGSRRRLVYAGRNGLPYTSIGRRLIETGRIPAAAMSLDALKSWLRAHGQELGGEARALMQENRSYIFFRCEPDSDAGPIGGQGVPLTAGVSIAVDRALWCYGLPVFIETTEPLPGFGDRPLRRLFVAQDTGSAIVGPARVDLFLGSGEDAGAAAGRIRHPARVTVLLPAQAS